MEFYLIDQIYFVATIHKISVTVLLCWHSGQNNFLNVNIQLYEIPSLGLHGTNVSYLKTKRTSQPVMEMEEESVERIQLLKSSGTSILSIDSLETNGKICQGYELTG